MPVRVDPSENIQTPLTRRELRERERARLATAGTDPLDGPAMTLPGSDIRPRFATISIAAEKPMTLAVEQDTETLTTVVAPQAPVAPQPVIAVQAPVAPQVPVIPQAPVAKATVAAPSAPRGVDVPVPTSAPALPSRRALRLAAQATVAAQAVAAQPTIEGMAAHSTTGLSPVKPVQSVLIAAESVDAESIVLEHAEPVEIAPIVLKQVEIAPAASSSSSFRRGRVRAAAIQPVSAPTVRRPQEATPAAAESLMEVPAESVLATRRERRSVRPRAEKRATAVGRPPVARPESRPQARASKRPARSKARRVLAKGFPLVAMTFVAGLMIATTTPAAALLSQSDVVARNSIQATAIEAAPREAPQSYTAASGDTLTVARDGYETSSVEKIAQQSGIRMEATYTNNPNGTIQWPFPVGVHIGDRYGYRDCAGCSSNHHGQDFNPGNGAPIQSIADGVVRLAEDGSGSLGVHMIIDHQIDGRLVSSVYAHMQHGSLMFQTGDTVKVGDEIGITGTTGMSTGPHLHFEIRLDGVTNVDPLEWLYNNTN